MTTTPMSASVLTEAIDVWERDPAYYDITPFHAFSLLHPTEASYLWQLSRGAKPPAQLVDEALIHLVEWELIARTGALTPLGVRLLGSSSQTDARAPTPAPTRESPARETPRAPTRRAIPAEAGRLSDRALHWLGEIAAGRNRIFAADERPPGWTSIERLGLATRGPGDRAELTRDGEELLEGVAAGRAEVRDDGWTRESAERYFAQVGGPTSMFDAGHQSGIRAALGLNQAPREAPSAAPSATPASGRVEGRLTAAKVLADLSKATRLPAAVLTRRMRRSGLTVRKHTPAVVYVSYVDHEDRGDQPDVRPKVLTALEAAGYRLGMADGTTGAAARAQARRTGAVLVARPAGAAGSAAPKARSSASKAKDRTIVIAWTVTEMRYDDDERRMKPTRIAKAAVWLNRGSAADYEEARAYAAAENEKRARSGDQTQGSMRVFVYPTTERDPLGRAKRDVMAEP